MARPIRVGEVVGAQQGGIYTAPAAPLIVAVRTVPEPNSGSGLGGCVVQVQVVVAPSVSQVFAEAVSVTVPPVGIAAAGVSLNSMSPREPGARSQARSLAKTAIQPVDGVPSLARDSNDVAAGLQGEGDSRAFRWVRADVGVQVRTTALFPAASVSHGENPLRAADGGSLTTLEVESQVECNSSSSIGGPDRSIGGELDGAIGNKVLGGEAQHEVASG